MRSSSLRAELVVSVLSIAVTGCSTAHSTPGATVATLRAACAIDEFWDGARCEKAGDARVRIAASRAALDAFDVDAALQHLAGAEEHGPLDHATHVSLWEQRGIAAGYLDDAALAQADFERLLALDPDHTLSYRLSTKATFPFESARVAAQRRGAAMLDFTWRQGLRLGDPVPIEVELVADPSHLLARAALFVRRRGQSLWHAADLPLEAGTRYHRLVLPAFTASATTALEVFARGYDDDGDEVLVWASPEHPREIPLKLDPPTPWHRTWWVWAIAGGVLATATGVTAWALTQSPSIDADTTVVVE